MRSGRRLNRKGHNVAESEDTSRSDNLDDSIVPAPEAAPEEGTPPDYIEPLNNLAKDEELAKNVRGWASRHIENFKSQAQRTKYCDTGGTMDVADRMWWAALRAKTFSAQTRDSLSDVTSTVFLRTVRTIAAGETLIFFPGDDMSAEYTPEINTTEYSIEQGKNIAEQQNMLEQFTFDEDKREEKIRETILWTDVYANLCVGIEWDHQTAKRKERVPDPEAGVDERGMPRKYVFDEAERTVSDWPTFSWTDMKDVFFDASIPELENQRVYGIRGKVSYETLAEWQRDGRITNLDKINASQLYSGDNDDDVLNDRMTNAGETATQDRNGLFEIWDVWAKLPIKESARKGKSNGKGKIDLKEIPDWFWCTYIGDISMGGAICVRLVRNPYHHRRCPHKLIHSHRDNKGAFHRGYASVLEPQYWQATANINQANNNVTLVNEAPWIVDGPVLTRNLKFRANKIIQVGRGVKFEQADVRDATGITMAMADRVERDFERTTGADRPILGEPLGSRASATEAKQTLDQANMPLDDKAGYVANQLFPWMLEMDAALWRQYGDPETVIRVTGTNQIHEINPTTLWGPIRTKVTAITRFKNNVIRRQELNSFIQNAYTMAEKDMDEVGRKQFWRDTFRLFGFDKAQVYFPLHGSYDATSRAKQAGYMMLVSGQWVEPQPQENHRAWLTVLEPMAQEYALLPDDVRNPENQRMIQQHMQIRRTFEAQNNAEQQGQGQLGAGGAGNESPTGLPGEVAANPMEAQAGAIANV